MSLQNGLRVTEDFSMLSEDALLEDFLCAWMCLQLPHHPSILYQEAKTYFCNSNVCHLFLAPCFTHFYTFWKADGRQGRGAVYHHVKLLQSIIDG